MAQALDETRWSGDDVTVTAVGRALARLRDDLTEPGDAPHLRTSVMTHLAWVPPAWLERAWAALVGMEELHPSRTLLLVPHSGGGDRIDAVANVRCTRLRELDRTVCTEVAELHLHGGTADAVGSVVEPLLVSDLPVFLRWRGQPDYTLAAWEQLVRLADRLIVDSTEWDDVPAAYAGLAEVFPAIVASDIAWARTGRWRPLLASLWPGIAGVERIRVRGTKAQAVLLGGWLRSRLGHDVAVEHEPAELLEGIELDGEPAPFPPGRAPDPSETLSDELDRYVRDPVYEQAVAAAAGL
ncbi:MAG TPA: glucose-6-phosphate dehydrogenase assembly protein OpcA [Gaiellaceae bacterium]|nr:glucose-6-phosphate dehydrogenase assembly protein OpcA [Gaiellaceae bacterium]